jgi:hypothetical protein
MTVTLSFKVKGRLFFTLQMKLSSILESIFLSMSGMHPASTGCRQAGELTPPGNTGSLLPPEGYPIRGSISPILVQDTLTIFLNGRLSVPAMDVTILMV